MAKPVDFVVGQQNLVASKERTLEGAAREHADAVLSAYELLEEARREQMLDLLRGAIGAKAEIMSALADFGSKPASVNAARNLISVAKVIGEIDPELVMKASTNVRTSLEAQRKESPPSIWQLFRRANRPDVRRGLALIVEITGAIGRTAE